MKTTLYMAISADGFIWVTSGVIFFGGRDLLLP